MSGFVRRTRMHEAYYAVACCPYSSASFLFGVREREHEQGR
jgi:hypothetical protein